MTKEFPTIHWGTDGKKEIIQRVYVQEHVLNINVSETLQIPVICTALHLKELVVGRLAVEGILNRIEDIEEYHQNEENTQVWVSVKNTEIFQQETEPLESSGNILDYDTISRMIREANQDMELHRKTAGTHSCYLFQNGKLQFATEDISRHNTVDKAIGYLKLNQINPKECALFVTGRVPTDMLLKLVRIGIPTLLSKSVPTTQAIAIARENHMQLVCRAWPDGYDCYQ